jgi:flagellar basal-body rod modification protein FlgD
VSTDIAALLGTASASPAAAAPAPRNPTGQLGKDEFLRLLVAQMSHQDPMNPMDGSQMAAQLAQFSSVEQLVQLNQKLESQGATQAALVQAVNASSAVTAFGRTVTAASDQFALAADGSMPKLGVRVASGGPATLKVMDASGRVVGQRELGQLASGDHDVELGSLAKGLPAGEYTFSVEVADSDGGATPAPTLVTARVDGIRWGPTGPVLLAGGAVVPFGSVLEIADR